MIRILKDNRRELIFMTLIAFIIYSVMIVHELTNNVDGLWHGTSLTGDKWEISLGRFLIPVMDRLHLGIHTEPFISILSLALFAAAAVVIVHMLCPEHRVTGFFICLLLVANTAVSNMLSFRFMALSYGVAFFLAAAAVFYMDRISRDRKGIGSGIAGIICLTLALSLYQAFIGCALVLLTFTAIRDFLQSGDKKDTGKKVVRYLVKLVLIGISCILYYAVWGLVSRLSGIGKSSYKGADQVGVSYILTHLPETVKRAYTEFTKYFSPAERNNIYQPYTFYLVLLVIITAAFLISVLAAKAPVSGKCAGLVLTAMIPLFANACLILAPQTTDILLQMSMPMAMVVPCLAAVTASAFPHGGEAGEKRRRILSIPRYICPALIFVLFAGSFLMVSVDQHEMLQTKEAAVNLMNRVAYDIESEWGTAAADQQYVFVGTPAGSPLYGKDPLYARANYYALYGEFYTDNSCLQLSYRGLLRDMGLNYSVPDSYEKYNEVANSEKAKAMPVYPADGSIRMIDGYCVVKVAEMP